MRPSGVRRELGPGGGDETLPLHLGLSPYRTPLPWDHGGALIQTGLELTPPRPCPVLQPLRWGGMAPVQLCPSPVPLQAGAFWLFCRSRDDKNRRDLRPPVCLFLSSAASPPLFFTLLFSILAQPWVLQTANV